MAQSFQTLLYKSKREQRGKYRHTRHNLPCLPPTSAISRQNSIGKRRAYKSREPRCAKRDGHRSSRIDSPTSIITVRTLIGERFPAHCTAAAKAILAWLPEREAYNIPFRNGMKLYTPLTIPSLRKLKVALDLTRRQGYATDHEELEKGLSGIAAPVLYKGVASLRLSAWLGPR